jgi:acyl-coenzyme A thioesterase PaaI-like protein
VTVQLNAQFLAPVLPGAFLKATGTVVRTTGSLVFMQGAVSVDDDEVLTGSAVLKLLTRDGSNATRE